MKFRKKPVVIDAVQWTGKNHREMFNFLGGEDTDYITASGVNFYIDWSKVEGGLIIKTLEGEHIATIGDWIIKGVHGEYYPCKPDIFEKTYEEVESTEAEDKFWDEAMIIIENIVNSHDQSIADIKWRLKQSFTLTPKP